MPDTEVEFLQEAETYAEEVARGLRRTFECAIGVEVAQKTRGSPSEWRVTFWPEHSVEPTIDIMTPHPNAIAIMDGAYETTLDGLLASTVLFYDMQQAKIFRNGLQVGYQLNPNVRLHLSVMFDPKPVVPAPEFVPDPKSHWAHLREEGELL